jgi:hypothetical protein
MSIKLFLKSSMKYFRVLSNYTARILGTWASNAKTPKPETNIEFLQPCPFVAADALLEVGAVVTSAVVSLDEDLPQTDTSVSFSTCQDTHC